VLYVEDMLVARMSMFKINTLKDELDSTFDMKDLGEGKQIFGM
jgi:hypothetical protein